MTRLDGDDRGDEVDRLDRFELADRLRVRGDEGGLEFVAAVAQAVSSPVVKSASNRSNNAELRSSADSPAMPAIACAYAEWLAASVAANFAATSSSPVSMLAAIQVGRRQLEPHQHVQAITIGLARGERRGGGRTRGDEGADGDGRPGRTDGADQAAPRRSGISGFEVHGGVSFRVHAHDSLAPGGASEQL